MATNSACTIVHNGPNGQVAHLPLQEVNIEALVIDVSARIVLSHIFTNPGESATGRAKYVFPVPARAAVCGFEMETSDGRLVIGVAKEKTIAEEEYKAAVEQGTFAGLVEWSTDDVFTMSVGSIPAKATVTTTLTCVMDLMDNDHPDEVRLQLPMAIGAMRYGTPPPNTLGASSAMRNTCLRIGARIQTAGEIKSVSSPSHGTLMRVQPYRTHHSTDSRHRTTTQLESPDFLTSDFVLVIRAEELDAPRCFAEKLEGKDAGTVALQLSVVPKFSLPPAPPQEYLFLVDRSGSMGGDRIETAKQTLTLLLRLLPGNGSQVNIFSFGSICDALWGTSQVYSQSVLESATCHIEGVAADYGGTEIGAALQNVFTKRNQRMRTVLFVLTDGESNDIANVTSAVSLAVSRSAADTPLRVFTLGIGDTASHAMCEGIARAGNGVCLMALHAEEIVGKCTQLMRAGRTSLVKNVRIEWGVQSQNVKHTPGTFGTLYSGMRFIAFAIAETAQIPNEVSIRGSLADNGGEVSLKVPVKMVRFKPLHPNEVTGQGRGMIHTLAARGLIRDLQDNFIAEQTQKRADIVKLGTEYSLASMFTSFVGVDEGRAAGRREKRGREAKRQDQEPSKTNQDNAYGWDEYLQIALDGISNAFTWVLGGASRTRRYPPGGWETRSASPSRSRRSRSRSRSASSDHNNEGAENSDAGSKRDDASSERNDAGGAGNGDGYASAATFSTLSSLESDSKWEDYRPRRKKRISLPPPVKAERRSPSPQVRSMAREPPRVSTLRGGGMARGIPQVYTARGIPPVGSSPRLVTVPAPASPPIQNDVIRLVRLQSFDGSFAPSNELSAILGPSVLQEPSGLKQEDDQDGKLWATALALAFFEKKLEKNADLVEGLREKVKEYVEQRGISRGVWKGVVERARGLCV